MAITYQPIKASTLDVVNVSLDGRHVGRIQRERAHAGGYYYRPVKARGQHKGDVFPTLAECKASLESQASAIIIA